MKNSIVILFAVFFILGSCKRIENKIPADSDKSGNVTKFSEIKTNPDFNWSTEKELTLNIFGLKTLNKIGSTLKITSLDESTLLYSGYHLMEESFSIKTKVAIDLKEVRLIYGSVNKIYPISGNAIDMDYIINVPAEGE